MKRLVLLVLPLIVGCSTICKIPVVSSVVPCPTPAPKAVCVGDCDGNGHVTPTEAGVCSDISLGNAPLSSCPSCDCNRTGKVTVDCVTKAAQNEDPPVGHGCP